MLAAKPITEPIAPKKQAVRRHFGSHPYFTRRPWNVVQDYIRHYAPSRTATVLDPFGGSGVTAIEATVLGKRAIQVDINPLANFICKQIAVAPIDLGAFSNEFDRIEKSCAIFISSLFSKHDSEIEEIEIQDWFPKGIRLAKNADAEFIEELFTRRQLIALSRLNREIQQIKSEILRDLMRFVFSATLNKCNRTYSTTHGRSEGRGNSGIMHTYRYWIPKSQVELNVWNEFSQKFNNIFKVKKETNGAIGEKFRNLQVIEGSATNLSVYMKPESVDYIFTDPPYGSHIGYLDLSTMWNAWLGFDVSHESKQLEAIEGGDLEKSRDEYADLMRESLFSMKDVLKRDGWLSIVFAHKDISYWHMLVSNAEEAGFQYVNTVVQDTFQFSRHKRANPTSVLAGELIMNFQKKRHPKPIRPRNLKVSEREFILSFVKDLIDESKSGLSTEEIYNRLVPGLLEHGMLQNGQKSSLLNLNAVLDEQFFYDEETARWFESATACLEGKKEFELQKANGQFSLSLSN